MKRSLAAIFSMFLLCFLNACGGSSNAGGGGGSHDATRFALTAPAAATAGTPVTLTVVALNSLNQTATGYSGTVHLTSSDAQAVLSGDSTLTNGTKDFSETFGTAGNQTITATDTVSSTIAGVSARFRWQRTPACTAFGRPETWEQRARSTRPPCFPTGKCSWRVDSMVLTLSQRQRYSTL